MVLYRPHCRWPEIEIDDTEVLVITPESPLGNQIMGLEAGQESHLGFGRPRTKALCARLVNQPLMIGSIGTALTVTGPESF